MAQKDRRCRRIPVVMQMEATECGAAALCMVLAYHGLWAPLEAVREACGVSRDGSKASSITKAARSYGMEAKGFMVDTQKLRGEGEYPCILYWNFNHFVVLQGFSGKYALLNDPARGRVKVPMEEFDRAFTGVAIFMKPGPGFHPDGRPESVGRFVAGRLHGSRSVLALLMLTGVLAAATTPLMPAFSRLFTDDILSGGAQSLLRPLVCAMLLAALFQFVAGLFHAANTYRVQGKLVISSRSSFMWHVLRLPMRFFAQRRAGDIVSRQVLNDEVAEALVKHLAPLLNECILLAVYLVIMFRYSVPLACIGIGAVLLTAATGFMISRIVTEGQRRNMRDLGMVSAATYTAVDLIETIKVSGSENGYFEHWAGYAASAQRAQVDQERGTRYLKGVPALIDSLTSAAVLLAGAKLIMDGHFSAGMLTAFQGVLRQFMHPADTLIKAMQSVIQMRTSMERIGDVMRYPEQPMGEAVLSPGETYEKLSGEIVLKDVTFGYSPLEPPLLKDFSLHIHPGDKIAIVGRSGCGKSTVAKLISGLYEPWSGEILYDGKPRTEIPREVFCGSLMSVDQDGYLFADTIYDNIKLWDDTISNAAAVRAARDAQIHEDIMARPRGYDHRMREGGKDFSGGQRQRLEIARVLSGEPSIAIFDEATSALDARTEYELTQAVAGRGITSIVIAHRLSTILDSDLILVLDKGRVVQQGRHEALYAEDGPYRTLVTSQ